MSSGIADPTVYADRDELGGTALTGMDSAQTGSTRPLHASTLQIHLLHPAWLQPHPVHRPQINFERVTGPWHT